MPIYQYKCNSCDNIEDAFYQIIDSVVPISVCCSKCNGIASKIFSTPNINVGVKQRVFHQWRGRPEDCPPDLRDALKSQDMPKGVSIYNKEGEPKLGTGDKFKEIKED